MKNESSFTLILRPFNAAQDKRAQAFGSEAQARRDQSFTLIELLIVIGILAVLATVAVLALNPLELIKQARDSQRMADLGTLNKALAVYQSSGQTNLGTVNTVYVSIPKNVAADCSDLGLPSLPSGWSYACVPSSTLRNINGTGWIPLAFSSVSYGTPLEKLPIDPINVTSTRNYYTYVMGGSWQLATAMESIKYKMGGGADKTSKDGGQYPGLYEEGTDFSLLPIDYGDSSLMGYWKFDEGSGTTAYDYSGNNATGTLTNGPVWVGGKVGSNALSFNGSSKVLIPYKNIGGTITYSLWINSATSSLQRFFSFMKTMIQINNDGGTLTFYPDVITGVTYSVNKTFTSGVWYYVVITQIGTTATAYVNGASLGSQTVQVINNGDLSDSIGSYTSQYFTGFIDDVRVYNRALSAAEVAAIYNATK